MILLLTAALAEVQLNLNSRISLTCAAGRGVLRVPLGPSLQLWELPRSGEVCSQTWYKARFSQLSKPVAPLSTSIYMYVLKEQLNSVVDG